VPDVDDADDLAVIVHSMLKVQIYCDARQMTQVVIMVFCVWPRHSYSTTYRFVQDYSGEIARFAPSIVSLYLEARQLARSELVDSTNHKVHYSLRTLVRAISFAVRLAPVYGLERSLLEGFEMSFLSSLAKDSRDRLELVIKNRILSREHAKIEGESSADTI